MSVPTELTPCQCFACMSYRQEVDLDDKLHDVVEKMKAGELTPRKALYKLAHNMDMGTTADEKLAKSFSVFMDETEAAGDKIDESFCKGFCEGYMAAFKMCWVNCLLHILRGASFNAGHLLTFANLKGEFHDDHRPIRSDRGKPPV